MTTSRSGSAIPTSAGLMLGAAGGIGLGVAANSPDQARGTKDDQVLPADRGEVIDTGDGGGFDAEGSPSGSFDANSSVLLQQKHPVQARDTLLRAEQPGDSDQGGEDGQGWADSSQHEATGGDAGGWMPAQDALSDDGGGFTPGGEQLLDYDQFAAQYGYGDERLLQDLQDAPESDEGVQDEPQETEPAHEAEDAGSDPSDQSDDSELDEVSQHEDELDQEILSHEGQVDEGEQIAEDSLAERDADDSGGDGGQSSASGSGRNVLRIDGSTLETLRTTARKVADNFDSEGISAAKNRDREAVRGYPDLAGAIKSFYDNWSAKRKGIVKSVQTYADWMDNISEGFEDSDRDLAASLAEAGAFEQDLYGKIREGRNSAGGDGEKPDSTPERHSGGDSERLVATRQSSPAAQYTAPAHSTTDVLRTIERIDGTAAYAGYVADFLLNSSGFATAGGYIGGNLGEDAVLAEGITALTELIMSAERTGQLPQELGFLSFSGVMGDGGASDADRNDQSDQDGATSETAQNDVEVA
ncbi:hypothetical protein [Brachybacterium subflavum]|uniref:hypothetical protein n=1 Tax=Brachybacterium subflavum TaxID=2585206 RepID=UPI001266653F|nr:hypothetical protein [Brachybacterium subflavum]